MAQPEIRSPERGAKRRREPPTRKHIPEEPGNSADASAKGNGPMNMQAPITAAPTPATITSSKNWVDALVTYRTMQQAVEDAPGEDDEKVDAAVDLLDKAIDQLVAIPAPTLEDAITKLDIVHERWFSLRGPHPAVDAIRADLRRLAAAEKAVQSGSLILALHRRFEQSYEAYNRVDTRQPKIDDDAREHLDCDRAMKELHEEGELIRKLILRQIPSTDEELTVIAMHLGLYEAEDPLKVDEQEAIQIATENVFDYLVSEGRADIEIGEQFKQAALVSYNHRRYRQGIFEL